MPMAGAWWWYWLWLGSGAVGEDLPPLTPPAGAVRGNLVWPGDVQIEWPGSVVIDWPEA